MDAVRLSRPCYDKPHRCPGWAGGGWRSSDDTHPCADGSVTTKTRDNAWWLDPGEKTCTCGAAITAHNPELGYNTFWVGADGRSWCPQTTPGVLIGHRPTIEFAHPGSDKWRFGYCAGRREKNQDRKPGEGCGVVTWPWALRRLDPTWWRGYYGWRIRSWLKR